MHYSSRSCAAPPTRQKHADDDDDENAKVAAKRGDELTSLTMETPPQQRQECSPSPSSSSSSNFKRGQSKVFYASDAAAVWDTGQTNQQQVGEEERRATCDFDKVVRKYICDLCL